MPDEPTMAKHVHMFDIAERAVICATVRQHHPALTDCHVGMFALLKQSTVLGCLEARMTVVGEGPARGYVKKLLHKVRTVLDCNLRTSTTVVMYLDPKKVAKLRNPERGVFFPAPFKSVEAGLAWSVGARDYVKAEMTVRPTMYIKHLGREKYKVTVEAQYVEHATKWLMDHFM